MGHLKGVVRSEVLVLCEHAHEYQEWVGVDGN